MIVLKFDNKSIDALSWRRDMDIVGGELIDKVTCVFVGDPDVDVSLQNQLRAQTYNAVNPPLVGLHRGDDKLMYLIYNVEFTHNAFGTEVEICFWVQKIIDGFGDGQPELEDLLGF